MRFVHVWMCYKIHTQRFRDSGCSNMPYWKEQSSIHVEMRRKKNSLSLSLPFWFLELDFLFLLVLFFCTFLFFADTGISFFYYIDHPVKKNDFHFLFCFVLCVCTYKVCVYVEKRLSLPPVFNRSFLLPLLVRECILLYSIASLLIHNHSHILSHTHVAFMFIEFILVCRTHRTTYLSLLNKSNIWIYQIQRNCYVIKRDVHCIQNLSFIHNACNSFDNYVRWE